MQVRTNKQVTEGSWYPLGATLDGGGVNFAIFSKNAASATLLLFDGPRDSSPTDIIPLENRTRFTWHARVEGIGAGQLYGYRIDGPYDPPAGHRFNRHKLLLDPYARAVTGKVDWSTGCHFGYDIASPEKDMKMDATDNAAGAPKCIVVDDAFSWEGDRPPAIPFEDLVIYEVHLKGFTAHPSSGVESRGTYPGFMEKIPYLKELGINAVELLPVQECHIENTFLDRGLTNYWGYSTVGFFAPDSRFARGTRPGSQVAEFKQMVKELHRAGIEVILDVVYNHTGEGSHLGPTLCFRGVDNASYYSLTWPGRRWNMDYTGCGNSLNFDEPQVVKLVMDSLRYWVEVMHVDGFRFDLASVLGRERGKFDQISSFFMAVHQDPVISRVKLIAEPWDIAWDSYQVGNFPLDWSEWNGKYRDCVRKFAKSDGGMVPELAGRLMGSSDLYGDDGRTPYNSINFVTCHDGFTLADLVSYAGKHNEANGEENRDGSDENHSWNWGAEGETGDPGILALRRRIAKNLAAIMMVSQGVPMLLGGDEMLRTQKGNNNAYCQDNEIGWYDWGLLGKNRDFHDFCRKMIRFRLAHPALRRKFFFCGADRNRDSIKDVTWFGANLEDPDWGNPDLRHLALRLQGSETGPGGGKEDADLFIMLNSRWEKILFHLPPLAGGRRWHRVVDTALPPGQDIVEEGMEVPITTAGGYLAEERSVVILVAR
jgi:isoamylase